MTTYIAHGFLHSRIFAFMGIRKTQFFLLLFIFFLFIITLHLCHAVETITSTRRIRDPETITCPSGTFKLGFFSLGNSSNRYVGIWFNNVPGEKTVVWVANRDVPLRDSSGVFTIGDDRNLVVLDGKNSILWTTNVTDIVLSSHAELLDSGNLILREGNSSNGNDNGRIIWQSFDHPSNTILQDMKLGVDLRTGEKKVVPSWKSNTDPSKGNFFVELDPVGIPQIIIRNGLKRHWRSGPWNGRVFIGVQEMNSVVLNGFSLVRDNQERSLYMTYSYVNKSVSVGYVLNSQGALVEKRWEEGDKKWVEDWSAPQTECELHGKCGPYGVCDALISPICSCLRGFEPKSIEDWNKGNWSNGCVRRTQLQCERNNSETTTEAKADGFLKLGRMKVPDFVNWIRGWDLIQCAESCLLNCSCIAYSYDNGAGCMWWSRNLIDIQKFPEGGVDLFIRVSHSELDQKKNVKVIIVITVLVGVFAIVVSTYISWRWMAKQRGKRKKGMETLLFDKSDNINELSDSSKLDNYELPIFILEKLAIATNNFDAANKLGQGGFGPVYKGTLSNGREIAVKRLSKSSGQGSEEFKNEVLVISKLQHRNLVRLLGCCIEGEERMLIYEYMPNKSLDAFIFDPTKRALLDWRKRFEIILGICRGIIYLHRDSRLRVIHRDLKASNILLDQELNPKISDFGMARIFGGDELQANTVRVVGTYGYMSPEYAMEGLFSEKSDVFSFGVLLLELVSGRRNTSFYHHRQAWSLVGYVWKLWNEGKTQELVDPVILGSSSQEEILRCIHVGLLCVQDFAKDRPTVSSIVSMLNSEITSLPTPKQPAFTGGQMASDSDLSQDNHKTWSNNNVTITDVEGR